MEEVSIVNKYDRSNEEEPGHVGGCQLGAMSHTVVRLDDKDVENKEAGRTGTATLTQDHRGGQDREPPKEVSDSPKPVRRKNFIVSSAVRSILTAGTGMPFARRAIA